LAQTHSTPRARFAPAAARTWRAIITLGAAATLISIPAAATAARVSGVLVGYGTSNPLPSRDLHFQNAVTHDVVLAPTHATGSFAAELPPGRYDLRAERGAILLRNIAVGDVDVALGRVVELAPYAPARLFDLQGVAPSLLTSPAPSTAYINTKDPTVLPPDAVRVPRPKRNWSNTPAENPAPNEVNAVSTEGGTESDVALERTQPKVDNPDRPGAEKGLYEPPMGSSKPVGPGNAQP